MRNELRNKQAEKGKDVLAEQENGRKEGKIKYI
jgi:hypothetical protein